MLRYLKNSTLKRESASILMLWLIGMATYVIINGGNAIQVQILDMFVFPFGTIFALAFGLDWVSKQTTIAGPMTTDAAPPSTATASEVDITVPTVTTVRTTEQ